MSINLLFYVMGHDHAGDHFYAFRCSVKSAIGGEVATFKPGA